MHIKLNKELKQILELIAEGKQYKEIAILLGYSEITIKRRVKVLFNLYKVSCKEDLRLELQAEKLSCTF